MEPKPSRILDTLFPERRTEKGWKKKNRKSRELNVDRFCFLDYPRETLLALEEIAKAEAKNRQIALNFLMEECTDIAAFLVLGLMRRDMHPVFKGGLISTPVQRVVDAVELSQFLQMKLQGPNDGTAVWPFALRSKNDRQDAATPQLAPQRKDKVARDLVDSVQEWLRTATDDGEQHETLSPTGVSELEGLVLEILDNAERHGSLKPGAVGGWSIAGFMTRRERDDGSGEEFVCHVAIVSEGTTISEGLEKAEHLDTRRAIENYISVQTQLHGHTGPADILRTVMALQPGITRYQPEGAAGGSGFPRIINFLNALGGSAPRPPQITIISGSACLCLKAPYNTMQPAFSGSGAAKFIFFNNSNGFAFPPDPHYVFRLQHGFPGTIIAMRFGLSPHSRT